MAAALAGSPAALAFPSTRFADHNELAGVAIRLVDAVLATQRELSRVDGHLRRGHPTWAVFANAYRLALVRLAVVLMVLDNPLRRASSVTLSRRR